MFDLKRWLYHRIAPTAPEPASFKNADRVGLEGLDWATIGDYDYTITHCDSRVLHEPKSCSACDAFPLRQRARQVMGIAFTGHEPAEFEGPCPSDFRRGTGGAGDHWGPNRPSTYDPEPVEA